MNEDLQGFLLSFGTFIMLGGVFGIIGLIYAWCEDKDGGKRRTAYRGALEMALCPPIFFLAAMVLVGIDWFEKNVDPYPPLVVGIGFAFLWLFGGIGAILRIDQAVLLGRKQAIWAILRTAALALAGMVVFIAVCAFAMSVDAQISLIVFVVAANIAISCCAGKGTKTVGD